MFLRGRGRRSNDGIFPSCLLVEDSVILDFDFVLAESDGDNGLRNYMMKGNPPFSVDACPLRKKRKERPEFSRFTCGKRLDTS